MRKWSGILLIVAVITIAATIYYSFWDNEKENILGKVPQSAKSVIIVDLQALSTKLFFDELASGSKHAGKLVQMMPDSLAAIDWLASGISLSDNAVFFTTENMPDSSISQHLLMHVVNPKKFDSFMDSLSMTLKLETVNEKAAWSNRFKSLINWKNNFVLLSLFAKNKKQAAEISENILLLKKEASIMTDSSFMAKQTAGFDVLLYSKPYTLHIKKQHRFIQDNIESVISLLHFNDGELELESELVPINGSLLEKLFDVQKKELPDFSILDSSILKASFNIVPGVFFQIADELASIKFNDKKTPLLTAWDGRVILTLNGTKIIENEYISYGFDDDFNKVELKKITKDKIWDIRAIFGIDKLLLDSVLDYAQIYKSKKDSLLFKGSNFITKKINDSYLCYNKYVNRPRIKTNADLDNINIGFDFNKLKSIIKESKINTNNFLMENMFIDRFELSINKNTFIAISAHIYFLNKKQNAFFSMTEMFIKTTDKKLPASR